MHMSEVERIVDVADARSLEFTMQPGRILFLEMEGRLYRLKELRGHMSVRQRVLCRLSQDCVLHVLRERLSVFDHLALELGNKRRIRVVAHLFRIDVYPFMGIPLSIRG